MLTGPVIAQVLLEPQDAVSPADAFVTGLRKTTAYVGVFTSSTLSKSARLGHQQSHPLSIPSVLSII